MRTPLLALLLCAIALPAAARDQIRIVGSATVYPFTIAVAENYARTQHVRQPAIAITGTVAGLAQFCASAGESSPDIANASRPISAAERETCRRNGVTEIAEFTIGYDGIVLATRKGKHLGGFTRDQLWHGLARQIPVSGTLTDNPMQRWNEIDPALPDAAIEVIGPPPTSGTRDVFIELVLHPGCERAAASAPALADADRQARCGTLREDGHYVEAGEYYNLIVQRLAASSGLPLGLFPFSYLAQNSGQVEAVTIDGVTPGMASILDGSYPLARPLYLYVKVAHLRETPTIREFLAEYASEAALGANGYLAGRGLIPLPEARRQQQAAAVAALAPAATP
ncbi:MAG: substrate-binding domain-containing protein [Azospirillaceae bacterium]|nr:substrate-binding domain-containing protein [Azospirillaceae bacterium]